MNIGMQMSCWAETLVPGDWFQLVGTRAWYQADDVSGNHAVTTIDFHDRRGERSITLPSSLRVNFRTSAP